MAWVKFNSIDDFNNWHDEVKTQLGLPKLSVDEFGQEVPDSVLVTAYAEPHIQSVDDVRAFVEDKFIDGLTVTDAPKGINYEASSL
jgi:hypothetical protein